MARSAVLKTATAPAPVGVAPTPNKTVLATDASGKLVTPVVTNPVAAAAPVAVALAAPVTMAVVPNTVSTATPTPSAPIKTVVQQPLTVATPVAVVVPPPAVTLVSDSGVSAGATVSTSTLAHPNQGQNPNQTNLIASVSPITDSLTAEAANQDLTDRILNNADALNYLSTAPKGVLTPDSTQADWAPFVAQAAQIAGAPASDLAALGINVNANYTAHDDPYDSQPGNTTYPMVPTTPPILTVSPGSVVVPSSPVTDDSNGIGLNGPPISSTSLNGGTTSTSTDNSTAILGLIVLVVIYMVVIK